MRHHSHSHVKALLEQQSHPHWKGRATRILLLSKSVNGKPEKINRFFDAALKFAKAAKTAAVLPGSQDMQCTWDCNPTGSRGFSSKEKDNKEEQCNKHIAVCNFKFINLAAHELGTFHADLPLLQTSHKKLICRAAEQSQKQVHSTF